ncbi:citrate lyase acyl carrier protein [Siculibacillus lacustris]|uniref:Citrate lyase acyl carrier protein n=1 Tax=Siculibacillus lacustris TaxID=1549641 RepID=A0A4V2KT78_9HYPH|nr:citrate lyase acyl carrier protein [Siculibacillus lacustris]TBW36098.1 citrate lyase acyl carrier protein [Siculibacillus lacustris]
MKIVREALAGTLESSDLMVRIAPREEGLEVVLQSEVIHQFGTQIEAVVRETLAKLAIVDGLVVIEDKGALDCVIRARVQTAVQRAVDEWTAEWSALS